MEKIIKFILNYNPNTATKEQREQLFAYISSFALYQLDKKNIYDFSDILSINTDLQENLCHYKEGKYESSIETGNNFLTSSEYFVDHLVSINHETCHYAQRHLKSKQLSYEKNFTLCYYDPFHFNQLEYAIIKKYFPTLANQVNIKDDFSILLNKDYNFDMLHVYLCSFYSLQNVEHEAYLFGVYSINELFSLADKINLTQVEKNNLDKYKVELNKISFYTKETFKIYKQIRESKTSDAKIKEYIVGVSTSLFVDNPNFFNEIKTNNNYDKNNYIIDNLYMLIQTLEINYDDKFAHMLFKAILNLSNIIEKTNLLLHLFTYTNIVLNNEEITYLLESLDYYNKTTNKNLNFDDIMKEKYNLSLDKIKYKPSR